VEVNRLLRAFLIGVAALAATTGVALAAPHKAPPKTGPGCRPQVTVALKGTIAAAPGGAATLPFSLMITARHSNRFGHAYVKGTQPVTVTVTAATKIRRKTVKGLAALRAMLLNDRVLVTARVCKADLANGATPALTATRVVAHPA
jgi:hypothetical protein